MIKELVIAVNDGLVYVLFILLFVLTALVSFQVGVVQATLVLLGGGIVICVLSGFWIVLSSIHEIQQKQLAALEAILNK